VITEAVHQGKADIDEVTQATTGLKAQVKQLQSDMSQYTGVVSQVKSQSQDLRRVEEDYNALLSRVRSTQHSLGAVTKVVANSDKSKSPLLTSLTRSGVLPVTIKITGFNLGDLRGHVYVRPTPTLSTSNLPQSF